MVGKLYVSKLMQTLVKYDLNEI